MWKSCVALVGAAAHVLALARLLLLDANAPPFSALLQPGRGVRSVVVMHHKRLPELNATLFGLAALTGAERLDVVVSQTLRASEAAEADASGALVRTFAASGRLRARHAVAFVPEDEADGSFSVDAARYGTKRNSFRNMLHGLGQVFDAQGGAQPPAHALVLEDDIEVRLALGVCADADASREATC